MSATFDLNLLRVLLALHRFHSVTKAADHLDMSQSGFSSALARLRKHTGDSLFVRTSQGMAATPRAEEIIQAALPALKLVERRILAHPTFEAVTARTQFRLVMADVAQIVFLPRLIAHLQQVAPYVTVICEQLTSEALLQALATGEADLALGYFPELLTQAFFHQRLYVHTFVCMARRDHPLEDGKLTASAFSELGHIVVTLPARTGSLFAEWLKRHKVKRRVVLHTPHHLTIPDILEATDLIATVPHAAGARFAKMGTVKLLPLPFAPPPLFPVHQFWHRRNQNEVGHRWLRNEISMLFNDASDEWKPVERSLYGKSARHRRNS
jgi:DNA-binding transcriptional LysR family regulator